MTLGNKQGAPSRGKLGLAFGLAALAAGVSMTVLAFAQPAAPQVGLAGDPARQQFEAARQWGDKPEGITHKPVDFYSEGTRLDGQLIYATANEGKKLPVIVSATGWGGTASSFRPFAVAAARAGYAVFLFDYRGWGNSDGRIVLTGRSRPASAAAGSTYTAEVKELRTYVDPWEQTTDWLNAISYVAARPEVDPERIGIRGASFSGGHVIYVAAHDPRVKAVVSLIGAFDGTPENWVVDEGTPQQVRANRNANAARLAQGDMTAFPPPGQSTFSRLRGANPGNTLSRWNAADSARYVKAPALFVLGKVDALYDNLEHGLRACNEVTGPRKLIAPPNTTHYDIYGIEGDLATKAALDWFDKYILPPGQQTRAQREGVTLPAEPARGSCDINQPFVRTPGSVRGPENTLRQITYIPGIRGIPEPMLNEARARAAAAPAAGAGGRGAGRGGATPVPAGPAGRAQ